MQIDLSPNDQGLYRLDQIIEMILIKQDHLDPIPREIWAEKEVIFLLVRKESILDENLLINLYSLLVSQENFIFQNVKIATKNYESTEEIKTLKTILYASPKRK